MSRKKKVKSTLLEKRKVTAEEKAYYEKVFQKEIQKHDRDELAGGVSDDGSYIRLHDRVLS